MKKSPSDLNTDLYPYTYFQTAMADIPVWWQIFCWNHWIQIKPSPGETNPLEREMRDHSICIPSKKQTTEILSLCWSSLKCNPNWLFINFVLFRHTCAFWLSISQITHGVCRSGTCERDFAGDVNSWMIKWLIDQMITWIMMWLMIPNLICMID